MALPSSVAQQNDPAVQPASEGDAASTCLEARRRCIEMHVGIPFSLGNAVRPLHNGDGFFPPMLKAIREARHWVHLLTYIYRTGAIAEEFCEALCERARAGVTVRLVMDSVGSAKMASEQVDRLRAAGAEVRWFRKPHKVPRKMDKRSHRKVLVCDNAIGFTGGMGIGHHWDGDARDTGEWREMQFEFRGPSVYGLNASFWENWVEACPEARPDFTAWKAPEEQGSAAVQVISLDSGSFDRTGDMLVRSLFALATRRIDIVTAYLAPDRHSLSLLKERARSGIAIRLLLPGPHNDVPVAGWHGERYYREMLEAGIRVFRYQPTMMHAKAILIDDDLALVGSMNLDQRSFRKDEEIGAVVQDREFVSQLDRALDEDFSQSREVRLEEWGKRSLFRRLRSALTVPLRGEI